MFDIGFWELILIAVVALLVVGPERLPKLARVTGLWLGRASAQFHAIKAEIAAELRAEELSQTMKKDADTTAKPAPSSYDTRATTKTDQTSEPPHG
ncbi:Twin-arginine translocation protein TatB [Methylophaga frappieri]|uniref:Twin-arginine translocation protein TatB n=1 Tax=Methylophaga frappieri (strain ATCC BAA-2434 / DSM 25690 / JAM7) TaxID=754477 RepID=I1YJM4_METFJ|nr:Sec-independent protein translocase protein TatB [Methylophaga frappieri]AFJ03117.1 Twin-arginine translocation protein TatB [Methylophaga frappieri]